jgi:DNA-binding winged helix-turn-helix (wHTH) protein/tetratricopeptide (TPR) repeat protein
LPDGRFEFGPFRLDPKKHVLWRGTEVVKLTPKALALLSALVEQQGDVVPKQDLMDRVWPDTAVEEANLSVTVSALRKALGTQPGGEPYIQTVPRRGYRFAAEVKGPPKRLSLAVLPFRPLGGSEEDAPLGLGMADALISRLTPHADLAVCPTGTVRRYAELPTTPERAGAELGVDVVLDGTLQRQLGRLRLSVQLLPRIPKVEAWAEVFDEELTHIFAVQDSIAHKVAASLLPHLRGQAPRPRQTHTPDLAAYEAYLRGRYFWTRLSGLGLERAYSCFQDAASKDPGYALPHAGLAQVYLVLGFSGLVAPESAWPQAREAAERALELEATLADAHVGLGYTTLLERGDWAGARRHLERARTLEPDSPVSQQWYGLLLALGGDIEAARAPIARARERDPLGLIANTLEILLHSLAREHERELELGRRLVELFPDQFVGHWSLGLACLHNGLAEEAVAEHRRALELAEEALFMKAVLAWTLAGAGERVEAERLLAELDAAAPERYVSEYQRATIEIALGRPERALERLERAIAQRDPWSLLLRVDPMLLPVRQEPRLETLIERSGAPLGRR